MRIQVLAFAQARDILGFDERDVEFPADVSVPASAQTQPTAEELLNSLKPGIRAALPPTTRVAIDMEYSSWDTPLTHGQVLAIIPPVSGG
ncbi:MAG: MoaD/ThiS family protein [Candidatus Methylacidiphilales bacterium]|nr:MoaD/ThiS family protein [Candidatus Methylacidiphilales bacterium]